MVKECQERFGGLLHAGQTATRMKRNGLNHGVCLAVTVLSSVFLLGSSPLPAQELPPEQPGPQLVSNPPVIGTFFLLQDPKSPPYPFDPFHGQLPVYFYDGVFFVDDSGVDYVTLRQQQNAMMEGLPGLPGLTGGGGAAGCCNSLTNFTVNYLSNTNALALGVAPTTNPSIALTIQTSTTNASYDVFGSTNMLELSPPSLGRTNWVWLTRARGGPTNFSWGETNWCERFFQLGTMEDDDEDELTTAFEQLVSKTDPYRSDTDDDGRTDAQELADTTDPMNPDSVLGVRLAWFPFNDTNWLGSDGQVPLAASNAVSRDAWLSKGLELNKTNAALLNYRATETNTHANLTLRRGAVRLWFQTSGWTTNGPNGEGRLIEVGAKGAATTNGWWSLHFNTNGTQILFETQTNNSAAVTCLTASNLAWTCTKEWHQILLNYSPTNSVLYLDSSLVSTGLGVTAWPGLTARTNGFTVGSSSSGANQVRGLIEDLETFNHPLTAEEITANFQTNRPPNAYSNLWLWLTGDQVEFSTGTRVRNWVDQTCSANDAFQLVGTNQPIQLTNAINGRSAVGFFGTNQFTLPSFPTNWTAAEVYAVLKVESDPAPEGSIRRLWSFGRGQSIHPFPDGRIFENFFRYDNATDSGNPTQSLAAFHLYNCASTSNDWVSRINGTIHFGATNNHLFWVIPAAGNHFLGAEDGATTRWHGSIAEILLFNRTTTGAERTNIQNHLNARYGIW
jgi:hypothetical protein